MRFVPSVRTYEGRYIVFTVTPTNYGERRKTRIENVRSRGGGFVRWSRRCPVGGRVADRLIQGGSERPPRREAV